MAGMAAAGLGGTPKSMDMAVDMWQKMAVCWLLDSY